jgi:sporulation protein YlmC with PRC-barrel domain
MDPDGEKLGTVTRVVLEPETQSIVSVVAAHAGFNDREVVVPIERVESTDLDVLTVGLWPSEFDRLGDFEDTRNLAPPPDPDEVTSDIVKDPDVPDVLPVGAATGIESVAFTPILEEDTHVATGDLVVDRSTEVWANDGLAGKLKSVSADDDTLEVTGFLVESGLVFVKDKEVDLDIVQRISSEAIVLKVSRSAVKSLEDV